VSSLITDIRGIRPQKEFRPADEAELGEILAQANRDGSACYVGGGLTKRDWGAAPGRIDVLLSTGALSGCSDVDPDNLTLSAAAGTTVAETCERAEAVGRILPLDPGHPRYATIGGVVATGDQGTRAAAYGGLRDVVLGVRATLADGSAVKFGGRTMKNVSGYDMTRLFVGSFGVLGVITEVTFRLLPRYDTQAVVVLALSSLEDAKASVARILTSYLQPLALEVVPTHAMPPDFATTTARLPGGRAAAAAPATVGAPVAPGRPLLLAGFRGHRAAVDRSIAEVTAANPGAVPQVLRDDDAEALYKYLAVSGAGIPGGEATAGAAGQAVADAGDGSRRLGLRASVPISRALDMVQAAQECATANGFALGFRAGAARGRVGLFFAPHERAPAEDGAAGGGATAEARYSACLTHMRAKAVAMGGSLFVTGGAGLLPSGYDAWGDMGPALAIMKRIKERFDPKGVLNPGRFVGGI
jgi:glycolate oxidase FAD binding subunit